MAMVDTLFRENDTSWKPVWGAFSTIRDHHRELTLSLTADGTPVKLVCRVFDTGLGFRFEMSEASKGEKLVFSNGYNLADDQGLYFPQGERGVGGPLRLDELTKVSVTLPGEGEGLAKSPGNMTSTSAWVRWLQVTFPSASPARTPTR